MRAYEKVIDENFICLRHQLELQIQGNNLNDLMQFEILQHGTGCLRRENFLQII